MFQVFTEVHVFDRVHVFVVVLELELPPPHPHHPHHPHQPHQPHHPHHPHQLLVVLYVYLIVHDVLCHFLFLNVTVQLTVHAELLGAITDNVLVSTNFILHESHTTESTIAGSITQSNSHHCAHNNSITFHITVLEVVVICGVYV